MLNISKRGALRSYYRPVQSLILSACLASIFAPAPAYAEGGLADIYERIEMLRVTHELCKEADITTVNESAFQQWETRNKVAQIDAIVSQGAANSQKVADLLASARNKLRRSLEGKLPKLCLSLAGALRSEEFNLPLKYPDFYRSLENSPQQAKATPTSAENKRGNGGAHVSLISADMAKYGKSGAGPDWDEVEKVVLISSSNGFSPIFKPQLLFSNGDLYRDFDLALEDLNMEASRRVRPRAWGTWKEQGDGYVFSIPGDDPRKISRVYPVWPADKDAKLDGTWKAGSTMVMPSADLGMMDVIASAQTITFTRDGRFELNRSSGGSVTSGGAGVSSYANAGAAGKYRLSGYAITLQFNDGRAERVSFYHFDSKGEKSSTVVGIAGVTFIKQDD
ncbi:hypothetical protein HCH_06711 [Hahella chejuensis KCTC 2396]|uniref:Uncharacterized protein n=1 Tax=Hahella chejuensis (strain KCTC 2396) TaxID=349521 RepID=Q2S7N6_HAHCH|nr:hypothetical protein [Hahella chejuensis]ABC33338.1 hypothetical protein HCH_06711 [Hahella chejuensis KCTC 2396]